MSSLEIVRRDRSAVAVLARTTATSPARRWTQPRSLVNVTSQPIRVLEQWRARTVEEVKRCHLERRLVIGPLVRSPESPATESAALAGTGSCANVVGMPLAPWTYRPPAGWTTMSLTPDEPAGARTRESRCHRRPAPALAPTNRLASSRARSQISSGRFRLQNTSAGSETLSRPQRQ
jgi:hypothetical protein